MLDSVKSLIINIVTDYNLYSILFTVMWSCVWQLFIKEFYDDGDDDAVTILQ